MPIGPAVELVVLSNDPIEEIQNTENPVHMG
jgi:hypothetical protein